MSLDVLISTLRCEDPRQLIKDMGVRGGVVVVNQGAAVDQTLVTSTDPLQRIFDSTDTGLSRSRNKALAESKADYCLFADDDEALHPHYIERCVGAFEMYPAAGIIAFQVPHWDRARNRLPLRGSIGRLSAMRLTSVQLAVRRERIEKSGLRFDTKFGAGSRYGSGEEFIFLRDAIRSGIEIRTVDLEVAYLKAAHGDSTWFSGVDDSYLESRGAIFKRADPRWHSVFALQWVVRRRRLHGRSLSSAYSSLARGSQGLNAPR